MIEHQNGQLLVSYWQRIRDGAPAPKQLLLHPAEIKKILPNVFVLQRFDAHHFVFRLAGTGYCAMFGREFRTQNILSLFQGPARRYLGVMLDRVVGLTCLGVAETRAETLSGDHCYLEYVFLPVADSDGRINRVLGTANVRDWGTASPYDRFARQSLLRMQVADPGELPSQPSPPQGSNDQSEARTPTPRLAIR
jgi:hypothetical protein